MAELDVFEARFAAAYRRYLDAVPTDVDAAAMARAAATARPRARWAAWREALRPVPALAWLALLGLLLAALTAGLVVVGSQPQRDHPAVLPPVPAMVPSVAPVPTCPPGTNPDQPGPADQARPLGPTTMAFDRRAGRMLAIAPSAPVVETWTFDPCTNTWARMHPNQEPPDPGWEPGLVYDVDSDVTIGIFSRYAWTYDLGADTWTRLSAVPSVNSSVPSIRDFGPELVYDPVSGLVVAVDRLGGLWNYEVESDTWTPIRQETDPLIFWGDAAVAYDASVDRLIVYAPEQDETWLFDLRTGRWTGSRAATPHLTLPAFMATLNPAIAYDEAAKRTVISGSDGMATYDAAADRWEILYDLPGPDPRGTIPGRPERLPRSLAYDPLNGRLVAPGEILTAVGSPLWTAPDGADVGAFDVLAFDTQAREWTVMLEADRRSRSPE